ncbi:MAG: ribosome biogenesis GTPase YlqF [Eubacteriales bacterium]|nr:ribosome biogenesis GTPase YlqF [Eubacteriales bacterium]
MQIQWYPGHMTKAKRQMEEDIKLIDLVIEMIDARVPYSGRNPDIRQMGAQKARLIVLNKADLADERKNQMWLKYYKEQGAQVLLADSRRRASLREVQPLVMEACKAKLERDARRGIKNRPIRAMVAGIPNVGKSTFINSISGKASAKTGNKPGVTKGKQWIRLNKNLELLDTPGILWPRFDDPKAGIRMAFIGSVNDEILQREELSLELLSFLRKEYPGLLQERYNIEETGTEAEMLTAIARERKCLGKGGEFMTDKAARILLDEFRSSSIGRVTLETPADVEE